jgi:hypothetical protein
VQNKNLHTNFNSSQPQSPRSEIPYKDAFFRVPAILFDRGIYPRCLNMSEEAFKQFIYECSAVNSKFGTHRAGLRAVKKFLGFDEDLYRATKKELVKNCLVFRHRSAGQNNIIRKKNKNDKVKILGDQQSATN